MDYGFRIILTLIFFVKLVSFTEGFYRHPDAEMIPSNDNDGVNIHEQMILEAAVRRGMDPEAVLTLLRTGEPVTTKNTEPNGSTKTTTYTLGPDGSISSRTRVEYRSRHRPPHLSIPSRPNPWLQHPRAPPQGRTHVQTYTGPNGERAIIRSWSSGPELIPDVHETPAQPEENNWPDFNFGPETKPWEPSPEEEDPEWKIFDNDLEEETTTMKQMEPAIPKTWSWPDLNQLPQTTTTSTTTTTTTLKPKIEEVPTKKPLPSLEEFLAQQYGPKTNIPATTTTKPLSSTSKNDVKEEEPEETTPQITTVHSTTPSSKGEPGEDSKKDSATEKPPNPTTSKNVTPATVNNNLEPTSEKPLPTMNAEDPSFIENFPNADEEDEGFYNPTLPELRPKPLPGRTFPTEYTPHPIKKALQTDPQLWKKLKRAEINPESVVNVEGNVITNMVVQPTGRAIVTTSRLRPDPPYKDTYTYDFYIPSLSRSYIHTRLQPTYLVRPNSIEGFLSKFDLSKSLIFANNGQIVKEYVDDEGCTLTATFALTQPNGYHPMQLDMQPIK